MERERKRRKKGEINARERERRARLIDGMSKNEKTRYNKRAAKRKRASRDNQSSVQRQDERASNAIRFRTMWDNQTLAEKRNRRALNSDRMRKCRENQTPQERRKELKANSIRNTLAGKNQGPHVHLFIQKLNANTSADENLCIVAHRNMLMAEFSLPPLQNRIALGMNRVNLLREAKQRACVGIQEGHIPKRYAAAISRDLQKAIDQHAIVCAMESEKESMRGLTQDIVNLLETDPNLPHETKEYFVTKRKLLQVGYDLSIAQKLKEKTQKAAQRVRVEYDIYHKHSKQFRSYLQEINDIGKEAHLKVEDLLKQHASAENSCDKSFRGNAASLKPDGEKIKIMEEEHFSASGYTCNKCKENWFYTRDAVFDHENLCSGNIL